MTENTVMTPVSVQPYWFVNLPLQQQSVLFLAARGPDGVRKFHPCKDIQRAYRACVLKAAKFGRAMRWGEKGDSFMTMDTIASGEQWAVAVKAFFDSIDELPHHYLLHLMHGVEILGYKYPQRIIREIWNEFYLELVKDLHLNPETCVQMDYRLSDWNRLHWDWGRGEDL